MTFQFSIGGYFSCHFEVVLKKGHLLFYVFDFPMRIKDREPSHTLAVKDNPDWQQLIDFIKSLNWEPEYESSCLDGIQWELTFKSPAKQLKCYGNNAYPNNFETFTKLLKNITAKYSIPDELLDLCK